MKIFISYAHEDHETAEQIHQALLGEGHDVFWDRTSLPTGRGFHTRIRQEVDLCQLLVFLLSPESVADGSYCRTELKFARDRWPSPEGRVLPVRVRDLGQAKVPPYLASATYLQPEGNIAAEVLDKVAELAGGATHTSTNQTTPPSQNVAGPPHVVLSAVSPIHNVQVASPQGSMPGMQLVMSVTVARARGQMLQLVARFQFAGGPMLQANMIEGLYRDATGLVATGTMRRPVSADPESFTESSVFIPYYALNIVPSNFVMLHNLLVTVTAYLNEQPAGQSIPSPFQLRW